MHEILKFKRKKSQQIFARITQALVITNGDTVLRTLCFDKQILLLCSGILG